MRPINTREDWLKACLTRVTAGWPVGSDLPENTRISVGFPAKGRGRAASRVSEHYRPADSDGGLWEIFISPSIADAAQVARAIILEAAQISTGRAPDGRELAALQNRADFVVTTLPPYPHSALKGPGGPVRAEGAPGPGSRLLKVSCPACGYNARITRRWLNIGVPACPGDPAHGTMLVQAPRV